MPKVRIKAQPERDDDDDGPPPRAASSRAGNARLMPYSAAWFRDKIATYALGTIICGAAMVAAAAWMGGSLGFSWYLNNVAHFDVTYGSLGAVVAFMTWVWFSVMVVLLGAELNAEIEHQTALDSTTGAPAPMGERGAAMADSVGLAFHLDVAKIKQKAVEDGRRQAERVRRVLRR